MSVFKTEPDPTGKMRLLCAYRSEINFLSDCITQIKTSCLNHYQKGQELLKSMEKRQAELEKQVANLESVA